MINAGIQSGAFEKDSVPLGGMEISAGRVAPQSPACVLILLPGRKPKGQLEKRRNIVLVERHDGHASLLIEISVTNCSKTRRGKR